MGAGGFDQSKGDESTSQSSRGGADQSWGAASLERSGSPLAFLDSRDDFEPWLLGAADAFGQTLQPDGEFGTAKDDPLLSVPDRVQTRTRGLGPVRYDDELSFAEHVMVATGQRAEQIASEADIVGRQRFSHEVDRRISRAIRGWLPAYGAHTLYLLIGLAERLRIADVLPILKEHVGRGQLVGLSDDWKRCLGYRISALARDFASDSDAVWLLSSLESRDEYWTPYMAGNVASGLSVTRQEDWMSIAERHLRNFRSLRESDRRAQYSEVVEAVGLERVLVDSCAELPVLYGWKCFDAPNEKLGTYQLLKDVFGPDYGPVEHHVTQGSVFVCGGDERNLRDAAAMEEVVESFMQRAPADERDMIDKGFSYQQCRTAMEDLSGRSVLNADNVDHFGSALSGTEVSREEDLDPWDEIPDPLGDFMRETGMRDAEG